MADALKLPLLSQMLPEGLPYGRAVLVEYAPDSEWFALLLTLVAQALRVEHPTQYATGLHSPKEVRGYLSKMGIDVEQHEGRGTFVLIDSFSVEAGLKSEEKFFDENLRIEDASIEAAQHIKAPPDRLRRNFGIGDQLPLYLRHNDEKTVVDFYRNRMLLRARVLERAGLTFIPTGIYSAFLHNNLELVYDGIMDIRLQDSPEGLKNLIRIRSFKMVSHDKRWHELSVGKNLEVTLQT
jgi:KaiC/GvpD/RAD55 family RecA-like ATPase